MQNKKYLLLIALFCFTSMLFQSCNKDDGDEDVELGYNYFPMKVGDSLIYNVYVYDKDLNEVDSSYQLLERVESTFEDNEGRPTFRLERYIRKDDTKPWAIYKVWTANLTTSSAEKMEDNVIFIKLVFPLSKNVSWNGNIKNVNAYDDDLEDYRVTSIDEPLTQGSLNFDSSLTVTQLNSDNILDSRYYIEKYAAGVGMVYKEQTDSLQNNSGYKMKIHKYMETLIYSNK